KRARVMRSRRPALFEKIPLQTVQLLVNQIIGLVNETNREVGHHFRRAGFHELAVVLVTLRRLAAQLADVLRFLESFSQILRSGPRKSKE
ncbi:MAG TPA: hypothetical protein VKM56_04845, partial [Verrucomicrobiae bacterium]|nr:hypothetical protein [Verrucomicrobiae bacterium]